MTALRIGSLFSGYEGLGMGVQQVLGGDIAWVSDIEPGACQAAMQPAELVDIDPERAMWGHHPDLTRSAP